MKMQPKGRSQKAGLMPGTAVHIGAQPAGDVEIRVFRYDESGSDDRIASSVDAWLPCKESPGTKWVDVEGVHQPDVLQKLCGCFGLHPLVIEDIMNTQQRPKMEDYESYFYLVARMLLWDGKDRMIVNEQVSIVLGQDFVISFQEGVYGDVFDRVRDALRSGKGRIRKSGPDYLVYSFLDAIVDNYFIILENLGEEIECLQEELVTNPSRSTLTIIQRMKRQVIELRRSVWPLREVIYALEREEELVKATTKLYLRDVYDHTVQVIDTIESLRDTLAGMLDIYLSSVSNRLNEVMKVLTIIATIFMPLTFLAGVYGMNFKQMPELEWGYPGIWLVMLALAAVMVGYFKKMKWL